MTHPSVYQQEIDQILSKCVNEINYILQTHFKGHYKHNKNHEFIKLQTIFGTPCVTEMRSNQYGIEYKSGGSAFSKKPKYLRPDSARSPAFNAF